MIFFKLTQAKLEYGVLSTPQINWLESGINAPLIYEQIVANQSGRNRPVFNQLENYLFCVDLLQNSTTQILFVWNLKCSNFRISTLPSESSSKLSLEIEKFNKT